MSASPNRPRKTEPTPIDAGAVENLRYIRSTIEAAHTFTTVPGKGCIAMGVTALVAVGTRVAAGGRPLLAQPSGSAPRSSRAAPRCGSWSKRLARKA